MISTFAINIHGIWKCMSTLFVFLAQIFGEFVKVDDDGTESDDYVAELDDWGK